MSQSSARVLSTDALRDLHAALAKFRNKGRDALRLVFMETQHVLEWLEGQLKLWQHQAEKRHEEVLRCRSELALARSAPETWRTAVSEKEIALRKAQFRCKEAEDKVAAVRRWKRTLPQALNEYVLPPRRLGGFLDGDVQHALLLLDAKIESLQAYMALEAPAGEAAAQASPAPDAAPVPPFGGQP